MINRSLVRIKVVQTLFAYYETGYKTPLTAQKEMLSGFAHSYTLYHVLLDLINELTHMEVEHIEAEHARAQAMHETYCPSLNFANNKLAHQVFENRDLRHYADAHNVRWDAAYTQVEKLYNKLQDWPAFKEYQAMEAPAYEDDKRIWRKIFEKFLPYEELLDEALEEIELHMTDKNTFWTSEIDTILSFAAKSIKQFELVNGPDQPLLEMFDSEQEVDFAKKLLQTSIDNADKYSEMINSKLTHWDPERVAFMDRIIMQTALAEILNFPEIAVQITMNEFIEIAKSYSTENSAAFVNGVLDKIVQDLKSENKLLKAMMV